MLEMRYLFYIILSFCFFSCTKNKSAEKKQNQAEKFTATVIVQSELEAPITIVSNKERIKLFEEKGAIGIDTIQLQIFPRDLVSVGYYLGTVLKDTFIVYSQDTIIAKVTKEQITTTLRRAGKENSAKWNDEKLLPKNEEYEPIMEMYRIRYNIVPPPPPAPIDAPEVVRKEMKAKSDEFFSKKKDFSQEDTLIKYADKYLQAIDVYYNNRLNEVAKEPDSLMQKFYKSYVLYRKYVDMQRLQQFVTKEEVYPMLKSLCEKQANMNGTFSEKMALMYFNYNYLGNRNNKFLLTKLYDSVIPTEFPYKEKLLKEMILQSMPWKKYPREDIITYVDKFVSQYGENEKIKELKSDIEYDLEVTSDLNLISTDGVKITFEELRKQHEGKVLYVDFWASWCMPCRIMLPYSKELHKNTHNKDVVFIYLALSDKEKGWKEACKEEDLYENSYRIENSRTSTFVKKMGIKAIPHYMIYGKDGKLYQNDSPRPNTNEIRKILKDLTK